MGENKTLVVIVVYNRLENLKRWLKCWKMCDQTNTSLLVIHNRDSPSDEKEYSELCNECSVWYQPRINEGLDIGAMKEFFRMEVVDEYDKVLWITDDCIPMQRDFVRKFTEKLTGNIGLTCMEISSKNAPTHVRTTGFCLRKETAQKLVFGDIVTKEDCYQFEHRGGKMTLMKQIEAMGLKCVQVSDLKTSPLWDTGNRLKLNRWAEHEAVFAEPKRQKVTIICPAYNRYPQIISSLICQTHADWELLLIHDGPNTTGMRKMAESANDKRIYYLETESHQGKWGHPIRQEWLQKYINSDFIVITNADNYHTPTYIETMLKGFKPGIVATYCAGMIHSYTGWNIINCRLQRGYIDCAGVMVRKDVACEIGWPNVDEHSSDWTYFEMIMKKYGVNSFAKVPGVLLVHN